MIGMVKWNFLPNIAQKNIAVHDCFLNVKIQCFFFGGGGVGKGGWGRVVLPANDYGTSELCYFYTTYSWLQSDLCLTKVFGGSAEQFKDLTRKMTITWSGMSLWLVCKNVNAPVFVPFTLSDRALGISVSCLIFDSIAKSME